MSGRTKRILYAASTLFCLLAALAAAGCMWYFSPHRSWVVLCLFLVIFALLPLNVLLHELGHIFFGAVCGMKFISVKLGRFRFCRLGGKLVCRPSFFGNTAGECAFYPKAEGGMRGRFLFVTLGGAIFNFAYAAIFIPLFFLAVRHPVLLFFEMFAPLSVQEGIAALIPVQLPAGKTDGLVAAGILRSRSEEEIALRVLRAQGILYKESFSSVPHALLFDVPVVREDLPALQALLLLRIQSLLWEGDGEGAKAVLMRALEIGDQDDAERAEFMRYAAWFAGGFCAEDSPLYGVRLLEERLSAGAEK